MVNNQIETNKNEDNKSICSELSLCTMYLKHIKIRLIEKPDRHARSRTAQIQRALEKKCFRSV